MGAYNTSKHGKELNARMDKTPLPAKCAVTLFVSLFNTATCYALQPLVASPGLSPAGWAGLGVGWVGLLLETVADEQKLSAKQAQPDEPVMGGMYGIIKHPNYLGEILFYIGILGAAHAALPSNAPWLHHLKSKVGPCFMIHTMFNAAKRLDKKAETKYADNDKYKAYSERTRSLFPGLF